MRLVILSMITFLFVGCATSKSSDAKKIQESDDARVMNCTLLGTVAGNSSWGGWTASGLKDSAVAEALNEAAKLGATHIVWQNVTQANRGGEASGRAYKCN